MVNISWFSGFIHPRWCRISSINSMLRCYPSRHFNHQQDKTFGSSTGDPELNRPCRSRRFSDIPFLIMSLLISGGGGCEQESHVHWNQIFLLTNSISYPQNLDDWNGWIFGELWCFQCLFCLNLQRPGTHFDDAQMVFSLPPTRQPDGHDCLVLWLVEFLEPMIML